MLLRAAADGGAPGRHDLFARVDGPERRALRWALRDAGDAPLNTERCREPPARSRPTRTPPSDLPLPVNCNLSSPSAGGAHTAPATPGSQPVPAIGNACSASTRLAPRPTHGRDPARLLPGRIGREHAGDELPGIPDRQGTLAG